MEFLLRQTYYNALESFASTNNVDIIFPQTDNAQETEDNESNLIPDDFENNEIFYKCKIRSVVPDTIGIRYGLAYYKWIVQCSIYTKAGITESLASYHADLLKEEFKFGAKKEASDTKYTYKFKQETNIRLASPIKVANFVALPCLFTVATVR